VNVPTHGAAKSRSGARPIPDVYRAVDELGEYALRYGGFADFEYVYIEEAHAADEWPLGTFESHAQPRTIEQRVELARRFARVYRSTVVQNVKLSIRPNHPVCVLTPSTTHSLCGPRCSSCSEGER
jgi:hypothetical protein